MPDGQPQASRAAEADGPRLSVLMTCWNAASTVEMALSSVLAERAIPIECVVVDDGSTDETAAIVEAVAAGDPRVVLVRLPDNVGVSGARNRGLEVVRGEWLAFHDADDVMLPGGLAALMRPTSDPDVLAVVGQRIWSDGERTWLSPLYDIPDIRQPGRKSIATHPGLMYYAALAGKVFHRSLFGDLRFEGRVMGDQPWTIRALLRADGHIEVVGETVFEWRRPHPDRFVETITSVARASATGSVEMAKVAVKIFGEVSVEVDAQVDDPATRLAIKKAYFERLLRSDLGGAVRKALDRRDPATGQYFDALAAFLQSIPTAILTTSDALLTDVLRPPIWHWTSLVPPARPSYWRMADLVLRLDRGKARRIAGYRVIELAFVLQRLRSPIGPAAASAYLTVVSLATRLLARRPRR